MSIIDHALSPHAGTATRTTIFLHLVLLLSIVLINCDDTQPEGDGGTDGDADGDVDGDADGDVDGDADGDGDGDGDADGDGGTDAGGDGDADEESDADALEPEWVEPGWWHHYHANSRNTDRVDELISPAELEQVWSWPNRSDPADTQPGVSAFNGAALSSDQSVIYITTSRDELDNFYAIDTSTSAAESRVLWSYPLSPWATWSSALVDNDDTIFLSDDQRTVALEFPDGDMESPPELRWEYPHDQVSMSHGFTPWGQVFEVTIEGEISVYRRQATSENALIARARLERDVENLPIPLGVGLPVQLQETPPLRNAAYPLVDPGGIRRTGCVTVGDSTHGDESRFLAPGHIVYLWDGVREQRLLSSEPSLMERFFDTSFGGVFASNTPAIVQLDDDVARIFIATLGEYRPPALDDARMELFTDELLARLFYQFEDGDPADLAALVRPTELALEGTYAVDPDPETRCRQIDGDMLPIGESRQPYLYPAYGVPSTSDELRGQIDRVAEVDEMLAAGEEASLDDLRERWLAVSSLKASFRSLARGYYSGYLQIADFDRSLIGTDRESEALTVHPPFFMPAPSGTSAAITPAEARQVRDPDTGDVISGDGRQLVVLAAGSNLFAYDVGRPDEVPTEENLLTWRWDAGLAVGGSPTPFLPQDVGRPEGSGAAIAVLAGFRGVSLVQDLVEGGCEEASDGSEYGNCCHEVHASSTGEVIPHSEGACGVVYDVNPYPYRDAEDPDGTREERYYRGEALNMAVATSVVEAGQDYFYVAYTHGPAHDEIWERLGIGSWDDFIPRTSEFSTVRIHDGEIMQSIDIGEAPVCDSTIGTDGMVYSIHTSGLDQILHVLYPAIWSQPRGGIMAYRGVTASE